MRSVLRMFFAAQLFKSSTYIFHCLPLTVLPWTAGIAWIFLIYSANRSKKVHLFFHWRFRKSSSDIYIYQYLRQWRAEVERADGVTALAYNGHKWTIGGGGVVIQSRSFKMLALDNPLCHWPQGLFIRRMKRKYPPDMNINQIRLSGGVYAGQEINGGLFNKWYQHFAVQKEMANYWK